MTRTRRHIRSTRTALVALVACVVLLFAGVATAQAVTTQQGAATTTAPATSAATAGQGAGSGAGAGAGQAAGTKSGNGIGISIDTGADGGASTAIQVLVVMTVLALAPSIMIMMTGFTRILIVMGFVRNALGTPTMPPNQVLIGLSLFLTLFVMFPTFSEINKTAVQPYQDKAITQTVAIDKAQVP
ncbi:MAG: flagellar biosynthesis protein FliP, partial [Thermoleophilia bacterium]|nr:flagellar biosynthesis protein FliP [Thermoleophilia bacterium]